MNIKEFQNLIWTRYKYQKYWAYTTSFIAILAGLFLPVYFYVDNKTSTTNINGYIFFISIFLVFLGLLGLKVLRTKYKIRVFSNSLSKEMNQKIIKELYHTLSDSTTETNDAYLNFPYQRSWWTLSYSVHLLADDKLIGIHVQSIGSARGGWSDFGGAKRLELDILNMIY